MKEYDRWEILEKDLAKAINGKRTPGSGNGNQKGDVRSSRILAEAKCGYAASPTARDQMVIQVDWLEGIYHQAEDLQKVPLLALEWETSDRAFMLPIDYLPVAFLNEIGYTYGVVELRHVKLACPGFEHLIHFDAAEISCKRWMLLPWVRLPDIVGMLQPASEEPVEFRRNRPVFQTSSKFASRGFNSGKKFPQRSGGFRGGKRF